MLSSFFIPFITIGIAELGDKTQLAMILLASKTDKKLALVLGAFFGFLLVDGISVALGSWVSSAVPESYIKWGSSALFILFGILMLRDSGEEKEEEHKLKSPMLSAFTLITVMEMGDKTQIATAVFAARYEMLPVLLGAGMSLTLIAAISVYLGGWVKKKVPKRTVSKVAGGLFILLGFSIHLF